MSWRESNVNDIFYHFHNGLGSKCGSRSGHCFDWRPFAPSLQQWLTFSVSFGRHTCVDADSAQVIVQVDETGSIRSRYRTHNSAVLNNIDACHSSLSHRSSKVCALCITIAWKLNTNGARTLIFNFVVLILHLFLLWIDYWRVSRLTPRSCWNGRIYGALQLVCRCCFHLESTKPHQRLGDISIHNRIVTDNCTSCSQPSVFAILDNCKIAFIMYQVIIGFPGI